MQQRKFNVLSVKTAGHHFVFLYDESPASFGALGMELGRIAADGSLPLGWDDVNELMEHARGIERRRAQAEATAG